MGSVWGWKIVAIGNTLDDVTITEHGVCPARNAGNELFLSLCGGHISLRLSLRYHRGMN